jgi:hypothetical protein
MDIIEGRPNTCFICQKDFKHYQILKFNKKIGLKEVDLVTSHTCCSNLIKKRNKLLQDLVEVDYDIFARMV